MLSYMQKSAVQNIIIRNIYVVEFLELVMCISNHGLSYILWCTICNFNVYNDSLTFFRSFNDMSNSFEQTLSEGITTSHFSYEEYPDLMNGAPAEDEDER